MSKCDHLVPWLEPCWRAVGYHGSDCPECELPDRHDGPHRATMPDGRLYWWQGNVCACPDYCDTFASRIGPEPQKGDLWIMNWNCQ